MSKERIEKMKLFRLKILFKVPDEEMPDCNMQKSETLDIKEIDRYRASKEAKRLAQRMYPTAHTFKIVDWENRSHLLNPGQSLVKPKKPKKPKKEPKQLKEKATMLYEYAIIVEPEDKSRVKEVLIVPPTHIIEKNESAVERSALLKHTEQLDDYKDMMERVKVLVRPFNYH